MKEEPEHSYDESGTPTPDRAALKKRAKMSLVERTSIDIVNDELRLIAFYLPQFHRISENSEWWGPGFTEWTNVSRATPNFVGHKQPRIPRDLGYYDLTHPNTIKEQVELARLYGLHGFCFYHYWFSGRRILETPLSLFVASDLDFRFCMCWANENWTRAWDGNVKNILIEQKYAEGDDEAFIEEMLPYFKDKRYIKINGEPLLIVYRAKHIPDPRRWFSVWRDRVVAQGFPGLHISVVDFYDISNPEEVGANSLVEFPPHKFNGPQNRPSEFPTITNPDFSGGILDYRKMIAQSANRLKPSFLMFRGIIPGWDNTPRRQNNPTIVINSTPRLFGEWLRFLRFQAKRDHPDPDNRLVFINAWNEWGEGCYLEPDQQWRLSYLEETLRGKFFDAADEPTGVDAARSRLFQQIATPTGGRDISSVPISEESLAAVAPPSQAALKMSAVLRRWPGLHSVGRYLYGLWQENVRHGRKTGTKSSLKTNGMPIPSFELLRNRKENAGKVGVAVVLHLYYVDTISEIYRLLQNLVVPFDLHLTTSRESNATEIILSTFSNLTQNIIIYESENRGRDISPFISVYRSGALDRYDAVLKIHSKKSTYSANGSLWRDRLYQSVAGDSLTALRSIDLIKSGKAGIVGPHRYYLTRDRFWGANRDATHRLLKEMGVLDSELGFFAGSMFWFTPRAFVPLKNMPEMDLAFEPENGQQDGTLAHAIERAFCPIARSQGFTVSSVLLRGEDIQHHPTIWNDVPVL